MFEPKNAEAPMYQIGASIDEHHKTTNSANDRPVALAVKFESIPAELKSQPVWVLWRYEQRDDGKWTKPPYQPNGFLARVNAPSTWVEFDTVREAYQAGGWDGIGAVLRGDLCGIDLDHVVNQDGEIEAWAVEILREFKGTYIETSPGGDGFHVLAIGQHERCGKAGPENHLEMYDLTSPRYLTVTGHAQGAREITAQQEALAWLGKRWAKPEKSKPSKPVGSGGGAPSSSSVSNLIETIERSKSGPRFKALWSEPGQDRSAADLEFCALVSYFTDDPGLIDGVFRASGRMRTKWDERHSASGETYGAMTVRRALESDTCAAGRAARAAYQSGALGGSGGSAGAPDQTQEEETSWAEPKPISIQMAPQPFPLDALPVVVLDAVMEVQGFVKAPIPLVVMSALTAISLAAQAHVNVKRAEKLSGPVSLNQLGIAESGERKTTCDGFFTAPIRSYEKEQAELLKPVVEKFKSEFSSWEAEREGILAAIKSAAKSGKPTDKLRSDLVKLNDSKPIPPRVPAFLLGDETPENLAYRLAHSWPSAGLVSSEAGTVFGSHGMTGDSAMRNMALLNVLWDGGSHSIGRRTSESFVVKDVRLTVGLQVQESTLRRFFSKDGGLSRGTGFLARFLVSWPESTQGRRNFEEAPTHWPDLSKFHQRINGLLNQPLPIDEDGALSPAMLTLTPQAKQGWVEYHDAVEVMLGKGGELADVRDVASKSADNATRLAALLHVFEHGAQGAVDQESMEQGCRLAAWYLNESRRFFGELSLPEGLAEAAKLDAWLLEYCRRERVQAVGKNYVLQHGPLRKKDALDTAIHDLFELDRIRLVKDGKRFTVHVNPALLEVPYELG